MNLLDSSLGRTFEDQAVALCYAKRPPYPVELYEFLLTLLPATHLALDIGCGPGKISIELADHFNRIDAVDPSSAMIDMARGAGGRHANIQWVAARAEDAPLTGPYDLVAAGASIHWMDHAVVFPRLANVLQPAGVLAVISGDDVFDAPWLGQWHEFIEAWLVRLGRVPDFSGHKTGLQSYQSWVEIEGDEHFVYRFSQSLDDFITCQHSRATWARSTIGDAHVTAFDTELMTLLQPFAEDGMLHYDVGTTLVWGRPLVLPRDRHLNA
jgi:SAM-dependent methyltransferase